MLNSRALLLVLVGMVLGLVLWMVYFFYFHTDGHGRIIRRAESPEAEVRGQRLLARADALMARGEYAPASQLLDSLRDAGLNEAIFIDTDALMQRYDSLRVQRYRATHAQ